MIDTRTIPLHQGANRSTAGWAAKPKPLKRFRTTSAIIRFPAVSLLGVAMAFFGIGAVGLVALAILLTVRFGAHG
jgi:hypothetical protein